jgi:hypothetical protein
MFQPSAPKQTTASVFSLGRNTKEANKQAGHTRKKQNPQTCSYCTADCETTVRFNSELHDTRAPSGQCPLRKRNSWFKIINLSQNVDWKIQNCVESQNQLATKDWSTSKSSQIVLVLIQTWITRSLYNQERSRFSKMFYTMFFWFIKPSQTSYQVVQTVDDHHECYKGTGLTIAIKTPGINQVSKGQDCRSHGVSNTMTSR